MPLIQQIQQILASAGTPGTFATRHTARTDDIYFDVVGVGAVPLPMSHRTAQKLCDVAQQARYGLREKGLLDARVHNTWEIGKRQIKLGTRHLQRTLDPKLKLIARDLGLPSGAKLRAELHNLLVYGPGQFFAPHQDSEIDDGTIGSLVVLLPSESKGGALVIEHHDEKVSYRDSPNQLVLVAFYADCRHEVGSPHGGTMLGLRPLHDDCMRTLTKLVAIPPRAPGDWSITAKLGCKCDLCVRLGQFLRVANEQQFEWPLAKNRRAHGHGTITGYELPVTQVTRRVGRPLHAGADQDTSVVHAGADQDTSVVHAWCNRARDLDARSREAPREREDIHHAWPCHGTPNR